MESRLGWSISDLCMIIYYHYPTPDEIQLAFAETLKRMLTNQFVGENTQHKTVFIEIPSYKQ